MIAAVRGTLEGRGADHALVAVGGVVLRVSTSATTLRDLGEIGASVALQTHLYVREDILQLFGFRTTEELRLFETLLGITGIGPRLALSILSFASPAQVQAAILAEDANLLAKVPGVGRKTAARIILELRGKLTSVGAAAGSAVAADAATADAVEALQALGYSADEALQALQALGDAGRDLTPEQRVLAALRHIGQGR
ncbi:MAG: Holliday junction branch migration protein RuvA [Chloroflexi bacterium]|nr:Holliday junction branch migration protein RuvA [Chloroflexota bacterium]